MRREFAQWYKDKEQCEAGQEPDLPDLQKFLSMVGKRRPRKRESDGAPAEEENANEEGKPTVAVLEPERLANEEEGDSLPLDARDSNAAQTETRKVHACGVILFGFATSKRVLDYEDAHDRLVPRRLALVGGEAA